MVGCLLSARMAHPMRPMGWCHKVGDARDRSRVASLAVQSVLCGVGEGAGCLPTPLRWWPCKGGAVSRLSAPWARGRRAVRASAAPQPVGWAVNRRCPHVGVAPVACGVLDG